jgi:SAM-dependent methyltransferase
LAILNLLGQGNLSKQRNNMWLLILPLVIAASAVILSLVLLVPMLIGAPYVRTNRNSVKTVFELAKIAASDNVVDLGSGDGQLLLQAAQAGAQSVVGYEINPLLVFLSRRKFRRLGLVQVQVQWQSFWPADLTQQTVVLLFGISHIMNRLEKKLLAELPAGARAVSVAFKFPHWPVAAEKDNIRLYVKK